MISIIIPARNEEACIGNTLAFLMEHASHAEVLVAEGGSTDRTVEVARLWTEVVHGNDCTRAGLMNAGAAKAKGDVFLFLHADSFPPADFVEQIRVCLEDERIVGGAFDHDFIEPVFGLKVVSIIDRVRFRITRNYYGDQGIFVRREIFEKMGGFPERTILEDLEFSRRLKQFGRTALIRKPVRTSGRRFLKGGIARTFIWMVGLLLLYTLRLNTEPYSEAYRGANQASPNNQR